MIDSSAWIAFLYERDENHERAKRLMSDFLKTNRHMTDYAVTETVSFLLRKSSFNAAREAFELLTTSKKMQIFYNDELTFKSTHEIFTAQPGLSYVDANIVLHMQRLGLKELLSFDSGFDQVKEIKRIH